MYTLQITGLGVIKHKTDIGPFDSNDSYLKKTLTHSWKETKVEDCKDLSFC